jgi:CrcB protein
MSTAETLLAVGVGALLGAPSRYLLDRSISARIESELPWGTFAINTTGSFLLGLLTGLVTRHVLPTVGLTLFGVGFCGAYTTFSTFAFETVELVEEGRFSEAGANLAGSVGVGLGAAAAGLLLGLSA